MAAEAAKLRNREDFIEGERVWVEAKYFDDPKASLENRFSATCDKVFGVIMSVSSRTCNVTFEDGSGSYVSKEKLNLVGQARIINTAVEQSEESEHSGEESQHNGEFFEGKLVPGAEVVHNVQLQGSQRKFEIVKLVQAERWNQFDEDDTQ